MWLLILALLTPSPDPLAGLWKAKRWYGPEGRGPLVIQRVGTAYTADMMGRVVPVRAEKGALSFELPNGEGKFQGTLQPGGTIAGHWIPPSSNARFFLFATPVSLKPDGANRWSGEVVPFDDVFSFYLFVEKQPDGTLRALLRNPERDWGRARVERITLDGNVVKLTGQGGDFATGTYDAERDTIVLPLRGGTYEFRREGEQSDFYPRGKHPGRYVYRPPPARDDGWPTGTLEEANIDRAAMEQFIQSILDAPVESGQPPLIDGVLIARHGKLVLEEYFHGQHRDKLHDTRSAAKSLTAIVVGAALQSGAPLALSTPVYETDPDPRKRAMTLEHLLTMSSGYFCDDTNPEAPGNEDAMIDQTAQPDFYQYTLKVPMAYAPGEKAVYCSANPNLALGVLKRATGESAMATFDRLLGAPMKIRRYAWMLDHAGNAYGGGSAQLLPRDFMKLGQLMLNGGTWNGRRLLSRDFVTRASSPQYHLRNIYYGYAWWGFDLPYKDRTVYAYFAGGAGGQAVIVIPELDLVVATYGASYGVRQAAIDLQQNYTPRYILPAVREAGDDPNTPVVPREFNTPYGRSENGARVRPRT